MSETRVPAIPAPTDANLREVARAVKGILDVREGLVGDPLDAAVKFRDLVDGGVISVSLTRRGGGSAGLVVTPPAADDGYDPAADLTPPPAPQGFAATGLFSAVQLSWQLPSILNYAYTEIWRADTNSLGSAVRIATTPAALYSDFIGNSATKYYWIRFVTQANVVGPYNSTDGTVGTTSSDPAYILGLLTGQITESQLYSALQTRINLIDGSGPGSVNARVANEAYLRGQAIASEAATRLSGDQSLQSQIDLLSSGTSGDLSALITAVNNETAARIAADLTESNARTLADNTLTSAIDAEEVARSIGDDVLAAITTALNSGVSGVAASIKQESDVRTDADSASAAQLLAIRAQTDSTAGALLVEQEVRALADSVGVTQTTTLAARVDLGDSQNAAGLVIEQQVRADADSAGASQVISLASKVGDNLAALRVEQDVRSSETSSLASQTTSLAAITATSAAGIQVEAQARADADSAAASQVTSLAASTAAAAAAIVAEQTVRASDDAATASQVTGLASRVDVGDSTNAAAIQQEQLTRADADSAQASASLVLSSAVGNNASAIVIEQDARSNETQSLAQQSQTIGATAGSALAGLLLEQQARADADSASASQSQQLAAKVGDAVAGLLIEQSVSVDRDSALAAQSNQLVAAIGQAAAGISAEQSARADGDVAVAQQITGVAARLDDASAGVQEERIARASADAAIGQQITTIAADLGNNAAGIRAEQNARADADSAAAGRLTSLVADVGSNAAAIDIEEQVRADQFSSVASQTTNLAAATGSTVAAIRSEEVARTTADTSVAGQLSTLVAKTDDNAAAITTEALVRSNETSALATTATKLAAQVTTGALLPYDFTYGKADWTNTAAGAPASVTDPSGTIVTNDVDLGTCLEITDFDVVGESLLTKGVVPATQGVVYRITTTLKIVSSDGSVQFGHLASGLSATYASVGTSNLGATTLSGAALGDGSLNAPASGNVTLTGTGVFTISCMLSSSSGAQYGAWPAGSVWLRLGLRLATAETGLVVRVGSIKIEEVTAAAGIAMESFTRSTQDEALSKQVIELSSATANAAAGLRTESLTRAAQDSALSSQTQTLYASTSNTSAGLQVVSTAQATADAALASQVTTLQAAAGGNAVAIQTEATARATETGSLFAQYTVKIDNAGHVSGYGLASTANNSTPTSEFGVRADKFWVAAAATSSTTAPTSDLYKGRVWLDTSVTPNVTRYYTGSVWSTTPQAIPFAVLNVPGTVNGVSVPAGVYIDTAYIGKATIKAAQIGSVAADTIQAGYTSSVDLESATFFGSDFYIGGTVTYEYNDPTDNTRKTGIASVASPNIALKSSGAEFDVGYFKIKNGGSLVTPFEVVDNSVRITTATIGDGTIGSAKIADTIQSTNYSASAGWQINKAGTATFNNVTVRGAVFASSGEFTGSVTSAGLNGGAYSGYAWPASGTGFHLGPSGLLLGNANTGPHFQVTSTGDLYAPGFTIIGGAATFSGAISADVVKTASIEGAAVTSGYSSSTAGDYTSVTISVPAGASSIIVVAYVGDPYQTSFGGGKDAYFSTALPTGYLSVNGVQQAVQQGVLVWSTGSPAVGTYTVAIYRNANSGTMTLGVLVTKR